MTAVIAKALTKDYDVTIVTFDEPSTKDTTLYDLKEADIHYRFFKFPKSNYFKLKCSKVYSALYRKILPQNEITSKWYSHSSFLSEKRNALIHELKGGNYDVIVGVHASLAVRLATCKPYLGNIKLIGWIHNSYRALFCEGSRYSIEFMNYRNFMSTNSHNYITLSSYANMMPSNIIFLQRLFITL